MTDATVLEIGHRALMVAAMISAPALAFGLVVGLIISVFQAATQIHEMSLTFIPKIVAVALSVAIFGPWMMTQVVTFTTGLLRDIPNLVR